jgi:hypothetical protein
MFKGTPQFTRRRSKAINELPALVLPPVVAVVDAPKPVGKSCPKCGKTGRGLHFHIKACRGDVRGN